jgi:hypothetical protein
MPVAHMVAIENLQVYLETLPSYDTPEVFGLHSNADISFSRAFIQDVLDTIIDIQPKDSGGGGGESREAVVTRMCDDMLKKMPEDFNQFKAGRFSWGDRGVRSPPNVSNVISWTRPDPPTLRPGQIFISYTKKSP